MAGKFLNVPTDDCSFKSGCWLKLNGARFPSFDLDLDFSLSGDVLSALGAASLGSLVGWNSNWLLGCSYYTPGVLSLMLSVRPTLWACVDLSPIIFRPTFPEAVLVYGLTLEGYRFLESCFIWASALRLSKLLLESVYLSNPRRDLSLLAVSRSPVMSASCFSFKAICLLSSSCLYSTSKASWSSFLGGDWALTWL